MNSKHKTEINDEMNIVPLYVRMNGFLFGLSTESVAVDGEIPGYLY